MAAKKSSTRKYGKAAGKSVKRALHKTKRGTLKSGAGRHPKVRSREQAIAIGLSEAREAGAKVPRKKSAKKTTKRAATKSSTKRTARKSTRKRATKKSSANRAAKKSSR